MKRILSLFLILAISLPPLAGCRSDYSPDLTAPQLLEAVLAACLDNSTNLERIDTETDEKLLNSYLSEVYGLPRTAWLDAVIVRLGGAAALEVAVIQLTDGTDVEQIDDLLSQYLHQREGDFTGYSPDQAKLVSKGSVVRQGQYIGLFICQDPDAAAAAFFSALSEDVSSNPISVGSLAPFDLASDPNYPDRVPFTQPGQDDMSLYDTSAIILAWKSSDPSMLGDDELAIYRRCQEVLGELLKEDMSDLEKETAIYGWMVQNVNYDYSHQDTIAVTPQASFTPYGGLVNHKAVCLGYATTFQLLMDLAEVECITVVGAAFLSEEDHAWNMVRLNGSWYCVDVTWDANYREQLGLNHLNWLYFNVTSDDMALSNHQWDYSAIPEATATDHGQSG